MIYIDCKQGEEDWHLNRVGVTTASRAKDACDRLKSGAFTQKALGYAAQIAMEIACGERCDDTFVNFAMQRGSELEPRARSAYESATGNLVSEAGLCLTDDRMFGYSSDGLIDDDGLLEIKCPLSPLTVVSMWKDNDLSDYMHQMQMGLWLTGRKWLDFVMFDPRLDSVGKAIYVKRVSRDEAFIEKMEKDLMAFSKQVADFRRALIDN
jgi:hypothetical protein